MINVVVLVSGGGTNLQALIDSIEGGEVTGAERTAKAVQKHRVCCYSRWGTAFGEAGADRTNHS